MGRHRDPHKIDTSDAVNGSRDPRNGIQALNASWALIIEADAERRLQSLGAREVTLEPILYSVHFTTETRELSLSPIRAIVLPVPDPAGKPPVTIQRYTAELTPPCELGGKEAREDKNELQ
ncbi:hypothetical protein MRX96_055088 [Rhipicephalus microplus]